MSSLKKLFVFIQDPQIKRWGLLFSLLTSLLIILALLTPQTLLTLVSMSVAFFSPSIFIERASLGFIDKTFYTLVQPWSLGDEIRAFNGKVEGKVIGYKGAWVELKDSQTRRIYVPHKRLIHDIIYLKSHGSTYQFKQTFRFINLHSAQLFCQNFDEILQNHPTIESFCPCMITKIEKGQFEISVQASSVSINGKDWKRVQHELMLCAAKKLRGLDYTRPYRPKIRLTD